MNYAKNLTKEEKEQLKKQNDKEKALKVGD